MRRRVLPVALVMCWLSALQAGDFTMPGSRGRVRPPVVGSTSRFLSSGVYDGFITGGSGGLNRRVIAVAGLITAPGALTTVQMVNQQIVALPFVVNRSVVADSLVAPVNGTGGTGSKCHLGIYTNRDSTNELWPNRKMFQTGECSADCVPDGGIAPCVIGQGPLAGLSGSGSAPIGVTLTSNNLYWFVIQCDTTTPAPAIRAVSAGLWTFGVNSPAATANFDNAFNVIRMTPSYAAALPDPFTIVQPTAQYAQISPAPMIGVSFP